MADEETPGTTGLDAEVSETSERGVAVAGVQNSVSESFNGKIN